MKEPSFPTIAPPSEQPSLTTAWNLSTAHIRQSTADALTEAIKTRTGLLWALVSYTAWHDYGWIMFVNDKETDAKLVDAGYIDLAMIFECARRINVSYVWLDCDGVVYSSLPQYEWEVEG